MAAARSALLRRILPWVISAAALVYVFGYATDWDQLVLATRDANLPLFLLIVTVDKLVFFLVWALLQAEAIRRFVAPVPRRTIIAVRGGSELLRAVSNPLADASFLLGVAQVTGGRLDAVVVVALIPFVTHLLVLLAQITLTLAFLPGGMQQHAEVVIAAALGWTLLGGMAILLRLSPKTRIPVLAQIHLWLERIRVRELRLFFVCFVLLAIFDVLIQGAASRAFGVPIDWFALTARIPVLYLALAVPSVGNYGVREFAWAGLFSEFAPQDQLFAYAFAVNTIFLLLNVVIGVAFLRTALDLVAEVRRRRRAGIPIPEPLLHDATDP